MSARSRVPLALLPAAVPGLDAVVGGLPEYSFHRIAGSPGAGKTTLAHQPMSALATPACPALHLTVVGEPARIGASIHFVGAIRLVETISVR